MGIAGLIGGIDSSRTERPLDYALRLPRALLDLVRVDSQEKALYEHFVEARSHSTSARKVVLVQCVEDLYHFGLFGQIAASLREQQPVRVEQFILHSLNPGESKSVWSFIKTRLAIGALHIPKWVRLYAAFCDSVGYSSTSFRPISDVVDLCRAWAHWRELHDRKALIDLVIDGVPVGDLINDSYLRFKPAPHMNLKDGYLWVLIWQACRDIRRAKSYFSSVKPILYLTSYCTYIQHGVAVRVALQCGVRVLAFGNYQEFAKRLSIEDWVHTKNPDGYSEEFSRMDGQAEKLASAKKALSDRIAGRIDSATAYMKKSAYIESGDPVPNVRGTIVIFLHDFYDSPHVYRDVVFPDFWEWVCFTIDTLTAANIPFFLKPHPNQRDLSSEVFTALKQRYPALPIVPPTITNKQLAEAGMACAVTVHGTVAHEMAYLGIPTICCARHPHVSFEFCRTARNRADYAEALRRYAQMDVDKAKLRRQSCIFYYMHNLSLGNAELALRDVTWDFRTACITPDGDNQDLVGFLNKLSRLPAFKACISDWSVEISGHPGKG